MEKIQAHQGNFIFQATCELLGDHGALLWSQVLDKLVWLMLSATCTRDQEAPTMPALFAADEHKPAPSFFTG